MLLPLLDFFKLTDKRNVFCATGGQMDTKALERQEGGSHYHQLSLQPIEFIHMNQIPFCEANVIKYICRWRQKNGKQDLLKAKHYIDLLIQLEEL